jgi:hypothetical protein
MFTSNLGRWTTAELVGEVMRRTASDAPGLHALQTVVIRARLADGDRRADCGTQSELVPVREHAGVAGMRELGRSSALAVTAHAAHEVEPDTCGAHAHDHTHRRLASVKFAAHEHYHVHPDDLKADATLNGHTHARAHSRLPWESHNPA